MIKLRDYQQRAIDQLYDWFRANPEGNPVLNLPGGSGKSVVIAKIVQDALHNWPSTRVLMLVHSRELVAQNAAKLRAMWPSAPLGVYSAGLRKRQLGEPITYASVQSVRNRAGQLGHIDLVLVDEAHCISTTETGGYRALIAALQAINPALRIVGFTASPYRLGHGMITEGADALFSSILEPVTIAELVLRGHLSPLRSKITSHKLATEVAPQAVPACSLEPRAEPRGLPRRFRSKAAWQPSMPGRVQQRGMAQRSSTFMPLPFPSFSCACWL